MADKHQHSKKPQRLFWVVNICFPLFAGFCVYLFCRPDTRTSSVIIRLFMMFGITINEISVRSEFVRFYLCDILWAYALTCTVSMLLGQSKRELFAAGIICFLFEGLIEVMQKWNIIGGTFDGLDIAFEAIATSIAVVIIIYQTKRREL